MEVAVRKSVAAVAGMSALALALASCGGDDGGGGGVCDDPELVYEDSCQICAVGECCDFYALCLEDAACACWFECMGEVYDESECILACGDSDPKHDLNGCMNSSCNDECVHDG